MHGLTVSIQQRDAAVVAVLTGPADMSAIDDLDKALNGVLDKDPKLVVVDLSAVTYMNSLTIGTLVRVHQALRRGGGQLRLASPSAYALGVLHTTRIEQALAIYPSMESALR